MRYGLHSKFAVLLLLVLTGCDFSELRPQSPLNCWEVDFDDMSNSLQGNCWAVGTLVNENGEYSGWILEDKEERLRSQIHILDIAYTYSGDLAQYEGQRILISGRYEFEKDFDFMGISLISEIEPANLEN